MSVSLHVCACACFRFAKLCFPVDVTTKHPNLFTTKHMGLLIVLRGLEKKKLFFFHRQSKCYACMCMCE